MITSPNPKTVTLVTLAELAKMNGLNKSKLHYWVSKGLLKPLSDLGSTNVMVFDRMLSVDIISKIEDHQRQGKSLHEIKSLL